MKKIIYSIEHNTVWVNLYDTKLKAIMNFRGIYKGRNKLDCENWLKEHKKHEKNN